MKTPKYYGKVATLEERWNDIKPYAEMLLISGDKVLDIGCAEGLLTDEIAKLVPLGHVDAVEKQHGYKWLAKQKNISFHIEDILNVRQYNINKCSVIFCLGILHKLSSNLNLQRLLVKLLESKARIIFLRSTCCEILILDIAWANNYTVLKKPSKFHGQGPIYICQKLEV